MLHDIRLPSPCGRYFYISVDSAAVRDGNALSECNEQGSALFVASWIALLSDSPITSSLKPEKLYKRFYKRLLSSLRATVVSFSDLAHKLAASQFLMGTSSPSGEWIDEFRNTPVFFEYIRFYQTGDPVVFAFLYNFLSFGKKLEYKDDEFHKTAFRGWLDVERRLSDLNFNEDHCENIRRILTVVLPDLSSYDFWPKHGPKNVAERIGKDILQKHSHIAFDRLIDRAFFTGHTAKYGLNKEAGYGLEESLPDSSNWKRMRDSRPLPSRLHFVPKNLKTSRSICMEPTTLMYFQQGVLDMMKAAIEDSPFARFIRLEDQSYNRSLARFGSYTASIDTLDLSAASDSLSVDLVRAVFPTSWKIFMLATRNPRAKTPDGIISLKKFAPMGSAVCFPTQCIVFTAICVYASILHSAELQVSDIPPRLTSSMISSSLWKFSTSTYGYGQRRMKYQPLGVYGDDICCDSNITTIVKALLVHFGFEVNEGKSFTGSQSFRESCGGYYLSGFDVTPLYYRIKDVRRTMRAGHIYSQVHLINECFEYGYHHVRSFLIYSLRKWDLPKKFGRFAVPFVYYDTDYFGIKTFKCDNSHLKSRYRSAVVSDPSARNDPKPHLQRREYRACSIINRVNFVDNYQHERYALNRWWANHRASVTVMKNDSGHGLPGDARLGWRWTPVE